MAGHDLDTEQQLRLALLDLMPAPNNLHDAFDSNDSRIPHRIPGYQDTGSEPTTRHPGRPSHSGAQRRPDEQSYDVAGPLEQELQDRIALLESEAYRVNLPQTPPQSLPWREQSPGRKEQSGLLSSGPDDSQYTLIRTAERLEKLAKSLRRQAATAADVVHDQDSRAAQPRHPPSRQKPARRRPTRQELLNTQRMSGAQHSTANLVLGGYQGGADPVQRIMSPTVSLDGLYTKFVDIYLPRCPKGSTATAVLSFLLETPTVLPSPVPALEEAVRTLVLVSLGGVTGDHALLQEGVKHYGKALSSLRKSIANPQVTHYEHTFVAIMILLMCSHHTEIRTIDNGWVQHMWGAQHYYVARNSRSFQTKLGTLALSLARHASLSYSLLTRKASCFAKSTVYKPAPNDFRFNWSVLLFNTSLQIPALLERHDALMLPDRADSNRLEELDAACSVVELRLRSWFNEWTAIQTTLGNILFKEQPIEQFTPFSTLCKDRTFKSGYWFQDFSYAFHAVWYCVSMHYILQTRISLEGLRQEIAKNNADPRIDRSEYRSRALKVAKDICMCIPFLCQEQCGLDGLFEVDG
ncbi:hypothetical protein PRZ48_004894 [Zasmidium cellare]|uniref:Uncharacterized protein n=1 Tax=Zasmidium cellare TaxID=395010 RepID=A0ABR0EQV8_ZASCE|nr:hypothetical protein PRZ48_004894 [Zasmidium cellare]